MKLAVLSLSALMLPISAMSQSEQAPPFTAQSLSFESVARDMTLAPAIKEATGSYPGIMRLRATEEVAICFETFIWKPGGLLQFPSRDPKLPTEPAATPGSSLGTSIASDPGERPSFAEVVAILDVEAEKADVVLTIKEKGSFASSTQSVDLDKHDGKRTVTPAAFRVTGDLGVRQPVWAYRIAGDGTVPAPASTATTDADLRSFAKDAQALVVVYATFERAKAVE